VHFLDGDCIQVYLTFSREIACFVFGFVLWFAFFVVNNFSLIPPRSSSILNHVL